MVNDSPRMQQQKARNNNYYLTGKLITAEQYERVRELVKELGGYNLDEFEAYDTTEAVKLTDWLGKKLSPDKVKKIKEELRKNHLEPFVEQARLLRKELRKNLPKGNFPSFSKDTVLPEMRQVLEADLTQKGTDERYIKHVIAALRAQHEAGVHTGFLRKTVYTEQIKESSNKFNEYISEGQYDALKTLYEEQGGNSGQIRANQAMVLWKQYVSKINNHFRIKDYDDNKSQYDEFLAGAEKYLNGSGDANDKVQALINQHAFTFAQLYLASMPEVVRQNGQVPKVMLYRTEKFAHDEKLQNMHTERLMRDARNLLESYSYRSIQQGAGAGDAIRTTVGALTPISQVLLTHLQTNKEGNSMFPKTEHEFFGYNLPTNAIDLAYISDGNMLAHDKLRKQLNTSFVKAAIALLESKQPKSYDFNYESHKGELTELKKEVEGYEKRSGYSSNEKDVTLLEKQITDLLAKLPDIQVLDQPNAQHYQQVHAAYRQDMHHLTKLSSFSLLDYLSLDDVSAWCQQVKEPADISELQPLITKEIADLRSQKERLERLLCAYEDSERAQQKLQEGIESRRKYEEEKEAARDKSQDSEWDD